MNLNRIVKHLLLKCAIILAVIGSSCSRRPALLETVPADVETVVTLDLNAVARAMSVDFDAPKPFPDRVANTLGEMAPLLVALHASADLSETVAFKYVNSVFLTMELTDSKTLTDALETSMDIKPVEENGFIVFHLKDNGGSVAVYSDRAWIISRGSTLDMLREALSEAETANITTVKAVTSALDKDGDIRFAVSLTKDNWISGNVTLKTDNISATLRTTDTEGTVIAPNGFLPIDDDCLKSLPAGQMLTAAVGINGADTDWETLANALTMVGGFRARGVYDTLSPFLRSLNGTIAISASVADNMNEPEGLSPWNLSLLAHMPEDMINRALSTIRSQFNFSGIKFANTADGFTSIDFGAMKIFMGNRDGYLAVSTTPLTATALQQNTVSEFKGSKAALIIDIPSLGIFGYPFPQWGVSLRGCYRDDEAHFTLSLPGSDRPVLQSLMEL